MRGDLMISHTFKYLVAFTLLAPLLSDVAAACSCDPQTGSHSSQIRRSFKESSAVFSARVLSLDTISTVEGARSVAVLKVLEVWKGSHLVGDSVEAWVLEVDDGASCAYSVQVGEELMIYATGVAPHALTHCSLTGPLSQMTRDRPLLEKLRKRGLNKYERVKQ
jgi:hypothetical protein